MREILQPGGKICTLLGGEAVIGEHLASGDTSDIYEISYQGQEKILKYYRKDRLNENSAKIFYDIIREKVLRLPPSPEIISPIDMTVWEEGMFGSVLEPIPLECRPLRDYMLHYEQMVSFAATVDAAFHTVSAFHTLHSCGFCLQDASDGNFLISRTGKALLFDSDTIIPCRTDMNTMSKGRYAAPEVVFGRKPPDAMSDRYTLGVFLFILFCWNHPLEGKRSLTMTPDIRGEEKLYGSEALFIMDPNDTSNGPDPVIHRNVLAIWPYLPDYVQEIFRKAFSKNAIANPSNRPTERMWLQTLARLRNEIVLCACGNEIFVQNGMPCRCENCGQTREIPFRLDFPAYSIPAFAGKRIYYHQAGSRSESLELLGLIVSKKDEPNVLGLRNRSEICWDALTQKGEVRKVMPNDIIPLKDCIRFTVGGGPDDPGTTIEIRANT